MIQKFKQGIDNPRDIPPYLRRQVLSFGHQYLPLISGPKRLVDEATHNPSIDNKKDSEGDESDFSSNNRPLYLRHYKTEAWSHFTVTGPDKTVDCAFNANPELGADATMCVIPTQSDLVTDPSSMKQRANVKSEWLDRLVSLGCSILFVHGKWFSSLAQTAEMVNEGLDPFARVEKRINAAIDYCIRNQYVKNGRVIAIGSSRYGFGVLHAMAESEKISGAVAHQPIAWWPKMKEFSEVSYRNPIIKRNSLYKLEDSFPPRPLLIQTGYMDERIGQYALQKLVEIIQQSYQCAGASEKFSYEQMRVPGHAGRVPDSALDSVSQWLSQLGPEIYHSG